MKAPKIIAPYLDAMLRKVGGQMRIRLSSDARSLDYSVTDKREKVIIGPCDSVLELDAVCERLLRIAKKASAYPAAFKVLANLTERA